MRTRTLDVTLPCGCDVEVTVTVDRAPTDNDPAGRTRWVATDMVGWRFVGTGKMHTAADTDHDVLGLAQSVLDKEATDHA